MRYSGFDAYINEDSKILILGSFPSVKSREEGFFYGNPRNRFWRVLAEAFGAETPSTIEEKKRFLDENKIALWDMVTECEIEGSLDTNIKDYVVADIKTVVEKSEIERIILNGGMSAKLFFKHFQCYADMAVALPSTSPANAKFEKGKWLDALK